MNRFQSKWISVSLTAFAAVSLLWLTTARGIQLEANPDDSGGFAVIGSPLLVEPETPVEIFQAALTMVDLGSFDLARQYLDLLLSKKPTDDQLLEIREKFNSATLLRLANSRDLRPASETLLNAVNAATKRRSTDPKFIDGLISDLLASAIKRRVAIQELQNLGPDILPQLIARWQEESDGSNKDWFQYAILRMGNPAVPALLGALSTPNEPVKTMVIDTLGRLGARDAVPDLGYFAFANNIPIGTQDAARLSLSKIQNIPKSELVESGTIQKLYQSSLQLMASEKNWSTNADGKTKLWYWDKSSDRLSYSLIAPDEASLLTGTVQIERAIRLSPDKENLQALMLAFLFERDKRDAGWEQPAYKGKGTAFDLGLTSGPKVVAEALGINLKYRRLAGAVLAIDVLAQVATKNQLARDEDSESPILDALNNPDLRVQFAAAEAVMKLNPENEFRGASRIISIFAKALNHSGEKHALIIDPNPQRAGLTAGALGEMGYLALIANTGREGFKIAARRGDIDFAIIHANSIQWELTPTLVNFRADVRTTGLPIGISAPNFLRTKLTRLLNRTPRSTFVEETSNSVLLTKEIKPFIDNLVTKPLSPTESAQMTKRAVTWLTMIAMRKQDNIFDMSQAKDALFQAVSNPEISKQAMTALASLIGPESQIRLTDAALTSSNDIELRAHAVNMLKQHINKNGLLLSNEKIQELTKTWESSQDKELRTALSSLMGTLRPDTKQVGEYLKEHLQAQ